ncbi:hypothetical protein, partial [Nevskia soli]|uniref:hypothetical protein n=1 Tax=Nevskia soli TaxID=418856 RepID=UPI001B80DB42
MDNLSLGIARLDQKSGKRAGTVVPRHSTGRGGRLTPDYPADLARNRWPIYLGISGRLTSEYA